MLSLYLSHVCERLVSVCVHSCACKCVYVHVCTCVHATVLDDRFHHDCASAHRPQGAVWTWVRVDSTEDPRGPRGKMR